MTTTIFHFVLNISVRLSLLLLVQRVHLQFNTTQPLVCIIGVYRVYILLPGDVVSRDNQDMMVGLSRLKSYTGPPRLGYFLHAV